MTESKFVAGVIQDERHPVKFYARTVVEHITVGRFDELYMVALDLERELAEANRTISDGERVKEETRARADQLIASGWEAANEATVYAMAMRGLLSEAMVALHHVYISIGKPEQMRGLIDKIDAALVKGEVP